jgi:hypothetical protein
MDVMNVIAGFGRAIIVLLVWFYAGLGLQWLINNMLYIISFDAALPLWMCVLLLIPILFSLVPEKSLDRVFKGESKC